MSLIVWNIAGDGCYKAIAIAVDELTGCRIDEKLQILMASIKAQQNAVKGLNALNTRARATNFQGLKASHDPHARTKSEAKAEYDPFQRRVTRPIQYWSTKATEEKPATDAAPELLLKQGLLEKNAVVRIMFVRWV